MSITNITLERKSISDEQDIALLLENGKEVASKIGDKNEKIIIEHNLQFVSIPNEEPFITLKSLNDYVNSSKI